MPGLKGAITGRPDQESSKFTASPLVWEIFFRNSPKDTTVGASRVNAFVCTEGLQRLLFYAGLQQPSEKYSPPTSGQTKEGIHARKFLACMDTPSTHHRIYK